uniref:SH3 domain-containing protein n=1 Tax=Knipowitschia caucasica TaxID=637954 RepID=A0AAV2M6B7_KNICA
MMTLAKALYDNTAECPDELAFRKGDILMVMERSVEDTSGWWMCSLYGRQGLVPANRLRLLSPTPERPTATLSPMRNLTPPSNQRIITNNVQNIYQIPIATKPNSSEQTELLYKVPSIPSTPKLSASKQNSEEQEEKKAFNMASLSIEELYDVPSQLRRRSLFPVSTAPRMSFRKHSLVPISEMQRRFNIPEILKDSCIYDVPPKSPQDPNYNIRVPDGAKNAAISGSSSSSCDSLALSSSSPEPLREVFVRQDEVCSRLLDLQDGVCKAVPQIMKFVSSGWRSKNHMEKHLEEIKEAAVEVASSLSRFLSYALDIKGNARRLTDANLQARLYKQLCVVEDSGVVLQQTVTALNVAGWTLDLLSQDPGQAQTPDQLERFVMVARTIPEDVKRLVSMVNANGKLLFKPAQKDLEIFHISSPPEVPDICDQEVNEGDDDYVELQTKTDFVNRQEEVKKDAKENVPVSSSDVLHDQPSLPEQRAASLSEHCRLYFGALQKAIGGFVSSLQDGQPPEKFISQSKLVIMVGQRLVNALYREAQPGESRQSLLCKSNHLCALLKQLAVATKKAALHFPEPQAVGEAQQFAHELAQRAQHLRQSLEL